MILMHNCKKPETEVERDVLLWYIWEAGIKEETCALYSIYVYVYV